MHNPQLAADGSLAHLLTLEGLPAEVIVRILDAAVPFASISEREVKKVPLLRGRSVFNLFFETSTRTRTTFEIAAKRLSADVINLNIGVSSTSKGETLLDTIDNLVAMNADMFVVRHAQSGAPHLIAAHLNRTGRRHVHVDQRGRRPPRSSDAGAARSVHDPPLQEGLPPTHGRGRRRRAALARRALADPRPHDVGHAGNPRDRPADAPSDGRAGARRPRAPRHARGTCRMRRHRDAAAAERADEGALLPSTGEYFKHYGLTAEKLALARPDAIVMHPGPMNRGVEIDSAVADGERSVILPQVTFGIAVRMAVLSMLAG